MCVSTREIDCTAFTRVDGKMGAVAVGYALESTAVPLSPI